MEEGRHYERRKKQLSETTKQVLDLLRTLEKGKIYRKKELVSRIGGTMNRKKLDNAIAQLTHEIAVFDSEGDVGIL